MITCKFFFLLYNYRRKSKLGVMLMKKIKKFLSVLLSSLALAGGRFTGNNKVFAGGENKVCYLKNGPWSQYCLYISSERIPRLIELLKARLPKEVENLKEDIDNDNDETLNPKDKEKFYQTGVYKAIVGVSGLALAAASYAGASRIKNKNTSNTVAASVCSAIGLGTLIMC
jgi:hypothetical protein